MPSPPLPPDTPKAIVQPARARSVSPSAPVAIPRFTSATEPVTSWKTGAPIAYTASPVRPNAVSPPRLLGSVQARIRPVSPSSATAPAGCRCQSSPRLATVTAVPAPQLQGNWRMENQATPALPVWSRSVAKPVPLATHRSYVVQTPPVPLKSVLQRSSSAAGQFVTEPMAVPSGAAPRLARPLSCEASAPNSAASSSRHLSSKATSEAERPAVLDRLKVLLADPGVVAKTLQSCFEAAGGAQGQVPCHRAVRALCTAHTMLLSGLPSTSISEAKWWSLLKRAGVYSPEDGVTLDQLREVQAQTLGSLRDCFAPKQLLRSMRRVPRSEPRLKDRYEHFEFRAKGALGKVFRCRHIESETPAEIRQIRKDKVCVPMDYIRTSLHRISELDHPNVPRVVDCLEDFRNFFVVSEPIEALEVMDFMQSSFVHGTTVSEACVANLIRQVLDATAYCHSQQLGPVIHRDLQPESILVEDTEEGSARGLKAWVSCFGLQPLFDLHGLGGSLPASCLPPAPSNSPELTPEALPCSSGPEFLAPEVWRRDYGPKCDVWSCGCILFLLLTGRPPFPARKSVSDLVHAITNQEPDWNLFRNVSTAALALCKRMLDKDDMTRPTAQDCLRNPWLSGTVDAAPEPLLPETFSALMQSHAQSKFFQVLMNVVASEIKVGRLRLIRDVLQNFDPLGSGYISTKELEVVFKELGISAQTSEQALRALDVAGTGQISYTLFMSGCVDLVDDKMDHMLWKVFTMVDEDCTGEMESVVLEHFLRGVLENGAVKGESSRRGGDVERYLQSILDCDLTPSQAVRQITQDRTVATFEEVKQFVLLAAGDRKDEVRSQASERRDSELTVTEQLEGEAMEEAPEAPADEASFGVLPDLPNFKGEGKTATPPTGKRVKGRLVQGSQSRAKHSQKPPSGRT